MQAMTPGAQYGHAHDLDEQYAGRFDAAVADAAEAMHFLNRYAKAPLCLPRASIYALKNDLIALLFARGLCVGWNVHEVSKPEKTLYCYCMSPSDEEGCERCDYTGIHCVLPPLTLRYVVFRFVVGGRRYTWHQPEDIVDFEYSSAPKYEDDGDWDPSDAKPLSAEEHEQNIRPRMALVRWVLDTAEGAA